MYSTRMLCPDGRIDAGTVPIVSWYESRGVAPMNGIPFSSGYVSDLLPKD